MAKDLLTSLLQEQFMGCSVKRNSNPWAQGTAPVIKYLTHTFTLLSTNTHTHTHTLSLFIHPDHKIIATDEGKEQCFSDVLPVTDFHYKVLPWVWETKSLLKNGQATKCCSQSPSMLRFPHWMACQWRVEMSFVWEVGLSCVGPDNGWRADVNSRECIQGSSSGVL